MTSRMDLNTTPPLAKMRLIARREGLLIRKSRSTDLHWLVEEGTSKVLSPSWGVTADDLWLLLVLPSGDPRAKAIMKGSATS